MTREREDDNAPVPIFSGYFWEVSILKGLLENEGIESFVYDENRYLIASPVWGTVTLVVSSKDIDRAKPIVAQYEEKHTKKE
jgi:Putative prokaryotic signal transducing protein